VTPKTPTHNHPRPLLNAPRFESHGIEKLLLNRNHLGEVFVRVQVESRLNPRMPQDSRQFRVILSAFMPLPQGAQLGPYTIVALLGQGGMGVVYRARDERLQRDVAIKVLPPGLLSDEPAKSRFRKEALALARLSHPNIAAVFDVGEQDGMDYLVMECVPGQTLSQKMRSQQLPAKEILSLGVQVAGALEEAHEQGVVHRDQPGHGCRLRTA
jgi:serine/threonine protein kinase